jgi:thioredoxin 1
VISPLEAGLVEPAVVDVDDSPRTAQQLGVLSIPTLILFRGGQEHGRVIGAHGKDHIVRTLLGDAAA